MSAQTFADRYRHWAPESEPVTDSDPADYDQYQAWANSQPLPAPAPFLPAFVPDPTFRFAPPQRPCGVMHGLLLVALCLTCQRCPDAPGFLVRLS